MEQPTTTLPERDSLTPMMQQWHDCKVSAKGALLLFRMGDFYEAFFQDAEVLAEKGGINLTKRSDIPMSGIPHHQLETYLNKLTKERLHIAIAEQIGDPKAKGLVERRVTRTITPGTVVSPHSLEEKNFNTIAALSVSDGLFGLAYCDVTTAELHLFEIDDIKVVLTEIVRLGVVELLSPPKFFSHHPDAWEQLKNESTLSLTDNDKSLFALSGASEMLLRHFGALTLDSFGTKHMGAAISSAGALITFARHKLGNSLAHIQRLLHTPPTAFMAIDRVTEKNLELFESASSGKTDTSLFNLLDQTATPMGGRSLRRWIMRPLIVLEDIEVRQEAIATLFANTPAARATHAHLRNVRDLERLTTRISSGYATPKDVQALGRSLAHINPAKSCLADLKSPLIQFACEALGIDSDLIADQINEALTDDPPWRLSDGGVIRKGYNQELDELRASRDNTSEWLNTYQDKIREESGIKNLKVAFNRVAGYYIEVSRAQSNLMPKSFRRTQTLTNNERFTAPELKAFEDKILHAEEKISKIEEQLFLNLVESLSQKRSLLLEIAKNIATIDVLVALSLVALDHGYTRPCVNNSYTIDIESGRHPVVESSALKTRFVPNDTHLSGESAKLTLLTGPNMGGKSTYIRQTALITLMAQMGSFVPAQRASIGIVDRLFSRIGAADDLARGQSTFMVEMAETANILTNASERSLILLDEIGRGTSTCDGIAIAKAVAEALLTAFPKGPRTLFATHFFELTELEKTFDKARNAHVSVAEANGTILFLHKITHGRCMKSYGIHVARLAGIPSAVVHRAEEILASLEKKSQGPKKKGPAPLSEPLLLFE